MQRVEFKNKEITMVGHLYTPAGFDAQKQYPAIVLCHPAGGVKEQTTGTYAAKLAEQGYVTLAYDSSYQGESSGMPREMEIPEVRIADISAGVDFLTTLPYVDNDRIGGLGICAGGGYMAAAAMRDPRIKTVGTVSAVNLGDGLRYGWGGHDTPQSLHLDEILKQAAAARTARMNGAEPTYIPLVPKDLAGVTLPDMIEAHEYYWTPRAHHERAVSRMLIDTLLEQSTFDAFHLVESRLQQPLMIVAGTAANTLWFSEDLYRRAGSADKTMHLVQDATHIAMYDKYVPQALEALVPFFGRTL